LDEVLLSQHDGEWSQNGLLKLDDDVFKLENAVLRLENFIRKPENIVQMDIFMDYCH